MSRVRLLLALLVLALAAFAQRLPAQGKKATEALEKGLEYLKGLQQPDGTWPHAEKTGMTALCALTLLECGVPRDDPQLQKAASALRRDSINVTHTYSLSLALLFFDRLGQPADRPLMECLGVRLFAGQNAYGGWSYHCPGPTSHEVERLTKTVADTDKEPLPKEVRRANQKDRVLSKEVQDQLKLLEKRHLDVSMGDSSNTLFATLGLNIAEKHGVAVEKSLAYLEVRLLKSQHRDSGWSYIPSQPGGFGVVPLLLGKTMVDADAATKQGKTQIRYRLDNEILGMISALGLTRNLSTDRLTQIRASVAKGGQDPSMYVAVLHGWAKSPFSSRQDYFPPTIYDFCRAKLSNGHQVWTGMRGAIPPSEEARLIQMIRKEGVRAKDVQVFLPAYQPFPPLDLRKIAPGYWQATEFEVKSDIKVVEIDHASQPGKKTPQTSVMVTWAPDGKVSGHITVPSQGDTGKLMPNSRPVGSTPTMTADALLNLALAIHANPKSNPVYPLSQQKDVEKQEQSLLMMRKQAVESGLKSLLPVIGDSQDQKSR